MIIILIKAAGILFDFLFRRQNPSILDCGNLDFSFYSLVPPVQPLLVRFYTPVFGSLASKLALYESFSDKDAQVYRSVCQDYNDVGVANIVPSLGLGDVISEMHESIGENQYGILVH